MNFLIFSAQFLPHMGGIENFTYNISKQLIKEGHKVTVVTNNTTQSKFVENIDGINVYRFNCLNLIDGRFPIYYKDRTLKMILDYLGKDDYDLIIINARFYFHSLFAAKYAKKRNIPSIIIDHGTSHLTVHNYILDYLGEKFEHALTNRLKMYCNNFYGVSKASSLWLSHFDIHSKGEIYNAVDIDFINCIKESFNASKFRKQYRVPNNSKVIVFTGRLLKEKGIVQLVDSIKLWNSIHNDKVYLFLAGEGPLKEYLDQESSEYIIPLGRLIFKDVIQLLMESDIFCLPSDSEGFSTSLLEAAACNDYIITTNRGGAKEVIIDDNYGLVIENNTNEEVFNALEHVLSLTNDELKNSVFKTYNVLINNFTWKKTAESIISIVKSMKS